VVSPRKVWFHPGHSTAPSDLMLFYNCHTIPYTIGMKYMRNKRQTYCSVHDRLSTRNKHFCVRRTRICLKKHRTLRHNGKDTMVLSLKSLFSLMSYLSPRPWSYLGGSIHIQICGYGKEKSICLGK